MPDHDLKPKTRAKPKLERPRMHKVILINDDYTPREFVVMVLEAEFGMNEAIAGKIMMTAHQKGSAVVAVYQRDVAETKATRAVDMAKKYGFPLMFTTEPEE
ncbi:ATP-dependent Clp protease adapter ClpS [Breoghania sp. JC706]|uniref:ATP-dependent Clp protease adapter ClpS n=1 Tax=Breoghania sp. JC706 TaxID=3117732 RepID=UPI00300882B6